jgi:hypothetical protein
MSHYLPRHALADPAPGVGSLRIRQGSRPARFNPVASESYLALIAVVGCWLLIGLPFPCQGADAGAAPSSLADLPNTANIHHQAQYCSFCHQTGPSGPLPSALRFGNDYQVGCRCHYLTPGDLRHPTDVAVPEAMRARIPTAFPLRDGQITCVSCHTFKVLCAPENPHVTSLRGAPFADRSDFCFRCHDDHQYERLNPHHQLDNSGKIVPEKCLFCHTQKPDEAHATYSSIKLIGGVEMLCQGCHNISEKHPAGKPHLVRPTLEYQVRMHALERQYGIVLPLDENGKLTCITCHNPHETGVIPKMLAGAKGAGEKLRHRLPKVLCAECHWHSLVGPNR